MHYFPTPLLYLAVPSLLLILLLVQSVRDL
jgi:hypothetical protein